ncbi:MAG: arginase family protein, partial [Kiloniellales bacterium]|nr:arginase family protein [Kiloniellales bacterium]
LSFTDRGERVRGICNLGRLDVNPMGLRPHAAGVERISASSDHMILDLTEGPNFCVGDTVDFELDYGSLVQAMLSPYVTKQIQAAADQERPRKVCLIAPMQVATLQPTEDFATEFAELGFALTRETLAERQEETVAFSLRREEIPILIGEDRAALAPLISAMAEATDNLGLLWLDARPDCDPDNAGVLSSALLPSKSGSIAAMADGCVLVGLSEATRAEVGFIRANNLLAFTMEDVDLLGVREVTRRALERTLSLGRSFVLMMHASVARGMGVGSEDSGLSYREISLTMEMIAASGGLRAVGLTGLHTDAPATHFTKAYGYLLSAFGKRILGP